MSIFKKRDKENHLPYAAQNPQHIQNFNAPVGAVLNGENSSASINQSGIANTDLSALERHQSVEGAIEATKIMVERFISIYENHDIRANQIPKFVSNFDLKLSDFMSRESVINILGEELISWTCDRFGVEKSWVEGETDSSGELTSRIYEYFDCYKKLHLVTNLLKSYEEIPRRDICLYAFKNGSLTRDTINKSIVVLVFQEKIGVINQRSVYRYKPITTHWQWDYFKMRYQAKAIFMLCRKYEIEMRGFDLADSVIDKIVGGKLFPGTVLKNCYQRSWFPEDYVATAKENYVAEETEELEEVLFYLKDNGYIEFVQFLESE